MMVRQHLSMVLVLCLLTATCYTHLVGQLYKDKSKQLVCYQLRPRPRQAGKYNSLATNNGWQGYTFYAGHLESVNSDYLSLACP